MARLAALPRGVEWLREAGMSEENVRALNPCVPGEFTVAGTFYVNSGSPRVVYAGTEEGTLPLVSGRWYSIPQDVVRAVPHLVKETVSVARAVRLVG